MDTNGMTLEQALAAIATELEMDNPKLEIEVPDEEPPSGWIKVSDRLPDDRTPVLIYDGVGVYRGEHIKHLPQWETDDGYFYHTDNYKQVTHWMPLPEPPTD